MNSLQRFRCLDTCGRNNIWALNVLLKKNSSCLSMQQYCTSTDNTPPQPVYVGTLTSQLRAVKVFSLATSIGGVAAQPILIKQASTVGGTPLVVTVIGFVGFFTFVTPVLLHLLMRKYVTEMMYDSKTDKFTATVYNFLLIKRTITFTPEDVHVPDVGGMFTSFFVNGKPLFVEPSSFPNPDHYRKLMGYDKPLDFKLGNVKEKQ